MNQESALSSTDPRKNNSQMSLDSTMEMYSSSSKSIKIDITLPPPNFFSPTSVKSPLIIHSNNSHSSNSTYNFIAPVRKFSLIS